MKKADLRRFPVAAGPVMAFACLLAVAACPNPAGTSEDVADGSDESSSPPSAVKISSESEAEAAFRVVKSACVFVDGKLSKGFSSPAGVSGASGSASASGKKTQENYQTSYSSTTMQTTDVSIAFSDFRQTSSSAQIAGSASWYYYYYSKFAYSSSGSASSTKETESISATSLRVQFSYAGKSIDDTITIAMDSPDYTDNWDGTIKTSSGQSYSLYGYY